MPGPRVAYLLLWFPEPSQTFVLDEVNTLVRLGLDVRVYTLYGPRPATRLAGMAEVLAPVHHLGTAALPRLVRDLLRLGRTWGPGAARVFTAGGGAPVAQPGDRGRGPVGLSCRGAPGRDHDRGRHRPHSRPLGQRPGHRRLGGLKAQRHPLQLQRPGPRPLSPRRGASGEDGGRAVHPHQYPDQSAVPGETSAPTWPEKW